MSLFSYTYIHASISTWVCARGVFFTFVSHPLQAPQISCASKKRAKSTGGGQPAMRDSKQATSTRKTAIIRWQVAQNSQSKCSEWTNKFNKHKHNDKQEDAPQQHHIGQTPTTQQGLTPVIERGPHPETQLCIARRRSRHGPSQSHMTSQKCSTTAYV